MSSQGNKLHQQMFDSQPGNKDTGDSIKQHHPLSAFGVRMSSGDICPLELNNLLPGTFLET